MAEVNEEYMSKAEIIKCLQNTGLYLGSLLEGSRIATIVNGEQFYNKIISIDPNRFSHCKNCNEVVFAANQAIKVKGKLNVDDFGIKLEEHE
ncbi:hypothetical protein [Lactiplantibacillus plantarum]|uniref:hypothetical protein n=1 Tax=Lactiplantibacillus plantarum TaxID=1590 RepID=UPI0007B55D95|nr:hypothetical protein [Lactiplantibacillus plantarum]